VIQALIGATMFFYAARFVDSPQLRGPLLQAGGYFAFALVDLFSSTTSASPWTLSIKPREARESGTLEHVLVTQTSLPIMLAGSAIYPFLMTTIRIAIYILWEHCCFVFH